MRKKQETWNLTSKIDLENITFCLNKQLSEQPLESHQYSDWVAETKCSFVGH